MDIYEEDALVPSSTLLGLSDINVVPFLSMYFSLRAYSMEYSNTLDLLLEVPVYKLPDLFVYDDLMKLIIFCNFPMQVTDLISSDFTITSLSG